MVRMAVLQDGFGGWTLIQVDCVIGPSSRNATLHTLGLNTRGTIRTTTQIFGGDGRFRTGIRSKSPCQKENPCPASPPHQPQSYHLTA